MKFGSLQEMMDLAHKVEERNMVVERKREDYLSKHLKTAVATKWTVAKSNRCWTQVSSGLEPTRTTTINAIKGTESKGTAGEKQSTNSSVSSNASKVTSRNVRKLTKSKISKRELRLCY